MKVSLIGPVHPYRGGISAFTTALSEELASAGIQVQTVSFKRQYPSWLYPGESDKDPSLAHLQVPALYTLDPVYFWTWWQAVQQVFDFGPDLVIIQWWTTFWAPAFFLISAAMKKRGIRCVFCIHNVFPHENRLPDVLLSRLALSQADGFITLSPKESSRLAKHFPSARIFSARLPVPKVLVPPMDRSAARESLGIDACQPVLLFFGIVRPYKGLSVLIDALGLLRKEGLRPFLIVAGEFWDGIQHYQQQIAALGLSDQALLVNRYVPNEELGRIFAASDAFVAPYIQGTQSAAIKTAMSYQLPILASDQISGDLDHSVYPIFTHQAGNAGDLAGSIRTFLNLDPQRMTFPTEAEGWGALAALVRLFEAER